MQKPVLKYILIFLTLAISFLSWWSVDRAITVKEASSWLVPTAWFSLLFILLVLDALLIKKSSVLYTLAFAALAVNVVFTPVLWHIVVVIFSALLISAGILRMRKELALSIEIRIGRIIKSGKSLVVFGLSLAIASQYFWAVHNLKAQALVPQVKIPSSLSSKILSMMSPSFVNQDVNGLDVDGFTRALSARQLEQQSGLIATPGAMISKEMLSSAAEQNEEMVLAQGRKQFSDLTGRDVRGDEQVSDIFSEIVNKKIQSYITPSLAQNDSVAIIPIIFALIIFLTAVSLGSMLGPIWALFTKLAFMFLLGLKVVTIAKVPGEIEVIQ